jgi:hypothetical protein
MEGIPAKPSRPLNAYFRYRSEHYQRFKNNNTEMKITELTKLIADSFRNLSGKELEKYEGPYKKEMDKWRKGNEEYMKKYGDLIKNNKKIAKRSEKDKKGKAKINGKPSKKAKADEDDIEIVSKDKIKSSSANVLKRPSNSDRFASKKSSNNNGLHLSEKGTKKKKI